MNKIETIEYKEVNEDVSKQLTDECIAYKTASKTRSFEISLENIHNMKNSTTLR